MSPPRLQLAHITKRYPAVVANSDVSLTVHPARPTPCWAKTARASPR
jgi:ABC-type sugar transport system ATPase subunit